MSLGIVSGLAGIVLQPIRGAQQGGGLTGFALGVERGLLGAVAKPVSGALAMVQQTAQASSNHLERGVAGAHVERLQRARVPRPFNHGRLLSPYDAHAANLAENTAHVPPTVRLTVVLYAFSQPKGDGNGGGKLSWPYPLHARLSVGTQTDGSSAETRHSAEDAAIQVDLESGIAIWDAAAGATLHAQQLTGKHKDKAQEKSGTAMDLLYNAVTPPLAFLWRSCLFSGKQRDAIASICILLYTFCAAYISKYRALMRYGIGTHPGAGTGSVFQD